MSATNEPGKTDATPTEQDRTAVTDARRPLLAVVGAGELAVTQIREQLHELPTGTRRLSSRAAELGAKVRDLDPAALRGNVETYLAQARSVYQSLADRGEQVIARRGQQRTTTERSTEPELTDGSTTDPEAGRPQRAATDRDEPSSS